MLRMREFENSHADGETNELHAARQDAACFFRTKTMHDVVGIRNVPQALCALIEHTLQQATYSVGLAKGTGSCVGISSVKRSQQYNTTMDNADR